MKTKTNKEGFSEYYKNKDVTGTYDEQRLKTKYRRQKRDKEMQIFLDLIQPEDDDKILEVGCSSGFMTQYLGNNVIALDTSEDMIKIAKEKHPNAKFFCMDMFDIPYFKEHVKVKFKTNDKRTVEVPATKFVKKKFNKVVTKRVMTHLLPDELARFFERVHKTLNDNGIFVFDVEENSLMRRLVRPIYTKVFGIYGYPTYQQTLDSITKILNKAGFAVARVEYLDHRVGRQMMIKAVKI